MPFCAVFKGFHVNAAVGAAMFGEGMICFRRALRIDQNPATGPKTWMESLKVKK